MAIRISPVELWSVSVKLMKLDKSFELASCSRSSASPLFEAMRSYRSGNSCANAVGGALRKRLTPSVLAASKDQTPNG